MKIGVIIQARMGSTRLPGKVMLNLMGKSVLAHVVERCQRIKLVNEVIIATSYLDQDDPIETEARNLGVFCYRGSEDNVLSRFYEAAKIRNMNIIVRITSDCPVLDPDLSNEVIKTYLDHPRCDYCTNSMERCFPRGLDVEVFSFKALEQSYLEAGDPFHFEHVTPYIQEHPDVFKLIHFKSSEDFSQYRWTLDTQEDWQLIQEIYQRLYISNETFNWHEVLLLMKQFPELARINEHVIQKT